MKHLRFLFALFAVVAAVGAKAQVTPASMTAEWQRAKAYTKEYLDAMPADKYSLKPTPEMRSFAAQMLHLTDANYFFTSMVTGKPSPMGNNSAEKTVPQTKEATTKAVMDSYDYVINAIQGMTPDQLNQMAKMQNKEYSKETLFNKAFEHQTHHRGQTTVYLRLAGVTPPQEKLF